MDMVTKHNTKDRDLETVTLYPILFLNFEQCISPMNQPKEDERPTKEKNELFPPNCNIPELKPAIATFNYGQEKHFDGMGFMESHASLFHTICSIIKSYKKFPEYDQIQKPSQICQEVPQDDSVIEEDQILTKSTQEDPVLTEDSEEDTQMGPVLPTDGQMGPVLAPDGQGVPVIDDDKQEHLVFTEGVQKDPVLAEEGQKGPVLAKEDPVLAEDTQEDKGLCKSIHSKQLLASKCKSIIAGRQQILRRDERSPAQMIPYVILINRSIPLPIPIIQSLCLAKKILCRLQCFTLRPKKKQLLPQPLVKQPIPKVQADQDFVTFDTLKNLQWKLYKGIAKRKPKTTATRKKSIYSIGKTPAPRPRDADYILPLIPKNWIIDESFK